MKLSLTRSIIDAIHSGALLQAPTVIDPVFGFEVVSECPGVPSELLIPRNTWGDKTAYDNAANKLAQLFINNFKNYKDGASKEVIDAGPVAR